MPSKTRNPRGAKISTRKPRGRTTGVSTKRTTRLQGTRKPKTTIKPKQTGQIRKNLPQTGRASSHPLNIPIACNQMELKSRTQLYTDIEKLLGINRQEAVQFCAKIEERFKKDFIDIERTGNASKRCDLIQKYAAMFALESESLFKRLPHVSFAMIFKCAAAYALYLVFHKGKSIINK
jgi:hypothetical protein